MRINEQVLLRICMGYRCKSKIGYFIFMGTGITKRYYGLSDLGGLFMAFAKKSEMVNWHIVRIRFNSSN